MNFYLRTKPISVRGSVALKLHAIVPSRNGTDNRIRLVDQCMPQTTAQEFINILSAGVQQRPGSELIVDGPVQPQLGQTFGPPGDKGGKIEASGIVSF